MRQSGKSNQIQTTLSSINAVWSTCTGFIDEGAGWFITAVADSKSTQFTNIRSRDVWVDHSHQSPPPTDPMSPCKCGSFQSQITSLKFVLTMFGMKTTHLSDLRSLGTRCCGRIKPRRRYLPTYHQSTQQTTNVQPTISAVHRSAEEPHEFQCKERHFNGCLQVTHGVNPQFQSSSKHHRHHKVVTIRPLHPLRHKATLITQEPSHAVSFSFCTFCYGLTLCIY